MELIPDHIIPTKMGDYTVVEAQWTIPDVVAKRVDKDDFEKALTLKVTDRVSSYPLKVDLRVERIKELECLLEDEQKLALKMVEKNAAAELRAKNQADKIQHLEAQNLELEHRLLTADLDLWT